MGDLVMINIMVHLGNVVWELSPPSSRLLFLVKDHSLDVVDRLLAKGRKMMLELTSKMKCLS